jgi:hypothetical protein
MIKHDIIPKNFKHRYLLSDFGWVAMDPLDGRDREQCNVQSPLLISCRGTSGDAIRHSDLILETRGRCETCDRFHKVSS